MTNQHCKIIAGREKIVAQQPKVINTNTYIANAYTKVITPQRITIHTHSAMNHALAENTYTHKNIIAPHAKMAPPHLKITNAHDNRELKIISIKDLKSHI